MNTRTRKKLLFGDSDASSSSWWDLTESDSLNFSNDPSRDGMETDDVIDLQAYVHQVISQDKPDNLPGRGDRTVFEEENTFAELAEFVETLIYQEGNVCPPTSPAKPTQAFFNSQNNNMVRLAKALSSQAISEEAISILLNNKALIAMDCHFGRNYGRLMNAARTFNNRLAGCDAEKFDLFLNKNGINVNALSEHERDALRRNISCLQLIVFLSLLKQYPLATASLVLDEMVKYRGDVYDFYLKAKAILNKITLTEKAYEPYRFEMEVRVINSSERHYYEEEGAISQLGLKY